MITSLSPKTSPCQISLIINIIFSGKGVSRMSKTTFLKCISYIALTWWFLFVAFVVLWIHEYTISFCMSIWTPRVFRKRALALKFLVYINLSMCLSCLLLSLTISIRIWIGANGCLLISKFIRAYLFSIIILWAHYFVR